jgi:hypothetical protein
MVWGRDYTCILLTKRKYNEILKFCLDLMNGAHPQSLYIAGNKQAYKWAAKYDALVLEDKSAVLVLCPAKSQNVDAQSTCLSAFQSIHLSCYLAETKIKSEKRDFTLSPRDVGLCSFMYEKLRYHLQYEIV